MNINEDDAATTKLQLSAKSKVCNNANTNWVVNGLSGLS